MAIGKIYQLINLRNWEAIFWKYFIQIYAIHAHSPGTIELLNHYRISLPIRSV